MTQDWPSRITRLGKERVNQLLAHPNNARRHPARQRDALRASMNTLGIVSPVVVNERTGYVLDGHARIEEFLSRDEHAEIDVLYVDLSEQEEAQFLATFDYITYLAEFDRENLEDLIAQIDTKDDQLVKILADIQDRALDVYSYAPEVFPTISYDQVTQDDIEKADAEKGTKNTFQPKNVFSVMCPHCGEEFYLDEN